MVRTNARCVVAFGCVCACSAQDWRWEGLGNSQLVDVAYDRIAQRLIGCARPSSAAPFVCETWQHDGVAWVRAPGVADLPMQPGTMTFDLGRNRVVMWNGSTWEFDGHAWTQVLTQSLPLGIGTMVYDLAHARCLHFGGWGFTPFVDTWEYDGVDWHRAFLNPNPPPRMVMAIAVDLSRGVTVLGGGLDDTWEYRGTQWVQTVVHGAPDAPLVYDEAHAQVLAVGSSVQRYTGSGWVPTTLPGAPVQTHFWDRAFDRGNANGELLLASGGSVLHFDGAQWHVIDVGAAPVDGGSSFAFDSVRDRAVLFGGHALSPATWEYDGRHWLQRLASGGPPARLAAAMVFDAHRARTVLFGGNRLGGGSQLRDTWEWDGVAWRAIATPSAPSARSSAAMVYDAGRRRCLLFGGEGPPVSFGSSLLADTWSYANGVWTQLASPTAPPARSQAAVAFDAARGVMVLHGGFDGSVTPLVDTWLFDTAWRQVLTPHVPPGRAGGSMVYDAARGVVHMFGGDPAFVGTALADDWCFDGSDWNVHATAAAPDARLAAAMTYDSIRGRTLLFGGFHDSRPVAVADTRLWMFDAPVTATWARLGAGCAGSTGVPSLDAVVGSLPALGASTALRASNLPPQPGALLLLWGLGHATWNGASLPLDLAALGLPGCDLWLAPSSADVRLHGGGSAIVTLTIPPLAALAGTRVLAQALVVDGAAANGIGASSNAMLGTVR